MTSLVKIQFLTDFELLFGRVFLDFLENATSIFHFRYTTDIFFWYVQGAEVQFITPNFTSAPCIRVSQCAKSQKVHADQSSTHYLGHK